MGFGIPTLHCADRVVEGTVGDGLQWLLENPLPWAFLQSTDRGPSHTWDASYNGGAPRGTSTPAKAHDDPGEICRLTAL